MSRRENPPESVAQDRTAERSRERLEMIDPVGDRQPARAKAVINVVLHPDAARAAHKSGAAELVATVFQNHVQADAATTRVGGNKNGGKREFRGIIVVS